MINLVFSWLLSLYCSFEELGLTVSQVTRWQLFYIFQLKKDRYDFMAKVNNFLFQSVPLKIKSSHHFFKVSQCLTSNPLILNLLSEMWLLLELPYRRRQGHSPPASRQLLEGAQCGSPDGKCLHQVSQLCLATLSLTVLAQEDPKRCSLPGGLLLELVPLLSSAPIQDLETRGYSHIGMLCVSPSLASVPSKSVTSSLFVPLCLEKPSPCFRSPP